MSMMQLNTSRPTFTFKRAFTFSNQLHANAHKKRDNINSIHYNQHRVGSYTNEIIKMLDEPMREISRRTWRDGQALGLNMFDKSETCRGSE